MLLPADLTVRKKFHFTGHSAGVFALEQGLKANTILSGGGDGVVAEWDIDGTGDAKGIARVPGNIFALLSMPESGKLICGDLHGAVYLLDTASGTVLDEFKIPGAAVYTIVAYAQHQVLVGSGTGMIVLRDINSGKTVQTFSISTESVRAIAMHPFADEIAVGCSDNYIYILDKQSLQMKHRLEGHVNSVFSVCFSPYGKYLLSGARDAQLRVWDAASDYAAVNVIPAHMFTLNDIRFSPDGRLFATAGRDKHIKIWDAATFNLLKVIDKEKYEGHINSVNKLFWSKWNNTLISCGDDRTVMGWEIQV